jgi:RNA polymerase sigma-70 factor (ECF subfamily)
VKAASPHPIRTKRDDHLTTLVGQTQDRSVRRLEGVLGRHDEAEDIVQDAWVCILGNTSFDPSDVRSPGFVRNKIDWLLCDRLRRRGRNRTTSLDALSREEDGRGVLYPTDEKAEPPWHRQSVRDAVSLLRRAIRRLSPSYREVVRMHLKGMSRHEIAESLEVTLMTVDMRLHHARQKLREEIGEDPLP